MKKDEVLMRDYLDGQAGAFSRIYDLYADSTYRYLLRRLRNVEDASDLLQATFLKFHRLRDKYRPAYPLAQWFYVLARSELVDFHRKNRSRRNNEKIWSELSQGDVAASLYIESDWRDWLADLEPEAREIFAARALLDESFEEIAARVGKRSDAVRQIFSRARQRLKKGHENG